MLESEDLDQLPWAKLGDNNMWIPGLTYLRFGNERHTIPVGQLGVRVSELVYGGRLDGELGFGIPNKRTTTFYLEEGSWINPRNARIIQELFLLEQSMHEAIKTQSMNPYEALKVNRRRLKKWGVRGVDLSMKFEQISFRLRKKQLVVNYEQSLEQTT